MMYAEAVPTVKNTLGNNLAGLLEAIEAAEAQLNRLRDLADQLNGPVSRAIESTAPTTGRGLVESYCGLVESYCTETRRLRGIITNISQTITEIQNAI